MNPKVKRIKKQLERAGGIVYLPKDLRDEVAELFLAEIENCPDCQRALDHLRAERDAEERGWEIIGVVHSHTHTEAYPSPTDVAQAPDPGWHYAIVSLRDDRNPSLRSYRIIDGEVAEEPVTAI